VTSQKSWDIITIVVALGLAVVILSFARGVVFFRRCLLSSKQLHHAMSSAVMKATIEFFDTNPSGRILNRFSADVGSNDVSGFFFHYFSKFFYLHVKFLSSYILTGTST
jgi:ATP-binding cassette subfamily C (CFTR/MRP) protein 4